MTQLGSTLAKALARVDASASLVVVVNDAARSTPTKRVIDALVSVRPELSWDVVVATGTHRHPSERNQAHVEAHGLDRAGRVHWHDARDAASTDAIVAPNRPVLAIGSVEPHYFAGWTGAHKTLAVGLGSQAWIRANHRHALDPGARPGRLDANPVYGHMKERLARWMDARRAPTIAVNLLGEGAARSPAAPRFTVGGPIEALGRLIPSAMTAFATSIQEPVARLVARVSPPLDRSFYQAQKGIMNHQGAVRDGGILVLVADCPDGIGKDHFMTTMATVDAGAGKAAAIAAAIEARGYALGDHKALRQWDLVDRRKLRLALVVAPDSPLTDRDAALCGMTRFTSRADALAWASSVAGDGVELEVHDAGQRITLCRPGIESTSAS